MRSTGLLRFVVLIGIILVSFWDRRLCNTRERRMRSVLRKTIMVEPWTIEYSSSNTILSKELSVPMSRIMTDQSSEKTTTARAPKARLLSSSKSREKELLNQINDSKLKSMYRFWIIWRTHHVVESKNKTIDLDFSWRWTIQI